MELTILGFMGGYPTNGVGTSAYLLKSDQFHLLIDVGSQAVLALEKHLDPLDLDAVLLTHYHPDHIADLGVLQHVFLLKQRGDSNQNKLLPVYGHTESDLERLRESEGGSRAVDYTGNEAIEIGPFSISFLKTIHPVPCYALAITEKSTGKKFVFSADSGYLDEFIPFTQDADLFLADANLFAGQEGHHAHMTSTEVGEIAEQARVKKLVLTHLPPAGNWNQLLNEAKTAAPSVDVTLAVKDHTIKI